VLTRRPWRRTSANAHRILVMAVPIFTDIARKYPQGTGISYPRLRARPVKLGTRYANACLAAGFRRNLCGLEGDRDFSLRKHAHRLAQLAKQLGTGSFIPTFNEPARGLIAVRPPFPDGQHVLPAIGKLFEVSWHGVIIA
jgi:hypothetical protein